jgi:hypothetical protein
MRATVKPRLDLTRKRFGRWRVVHFEKIEKGVSLWSCVCDCGARRLVRGQNLVKGSSLSCGCYKRERIIEAHRTHGMRGTKIYRAWVAMKTRCVNKNHSDYHRYGGRGITVCKRWVNSFENFQHDMGPRPTRASLERKNNNRGYSPSNCVWGTRQQQGANKATSIMYKGKCLSEWARELSISKVTLCQRYRWGWRGKKLFQVPQVRNFE